VRRTNLALTIIALLGACRDARVEQGPPAATASEGPWVRTTQGYSVRAGVRITGTGRDSVLFNIRVRNFGPAPARYTLEACEVAARAYRAPTLGGTPVWHSLRIHDVDCSGVGNSRTLAPGDSLPSTHWDLTMPVHAILGDSLPAGRYYFAVSSPLETFPDLRDALFVPAGGVDLVP